MILTRMVSDPAVVFLPLLAAGDPAPPGRRWIAVVIALVLIVCISVTSCINPRRGHRD